MALHCYSNPRALRLSSFQSNIMHTIQSLFCCCLLIASANKVSAASQAWEISSVKNVGPGLKITLADLREITVSPDKKKDESKFDKVKVSPNGEEVGWVIDYPDHANPNREDIPGKLVIWRAGRIERQFSPDQVLWGWTFRTGDRVAYASGPMHFVQGFHCELRDIHSGRLLSKWDGKPDEDPNAPDWTKSLLK
jgi:hypothetical protein